jgi:hypothetical protein
MSVPELVRTALIKQVVVCLYSFKRSCVCMFVPGEYL